MKKILPQEIKGKVVCHLETWNTRGNKMDLQILSWIHFPRRNSEKQVRNTSWKVSKYGLFSGPYFPAYGPNTEIYEVSLRIQSECGK